MTDVGGFNRLRHTLGDGRTDAVTIGFRQQVVLADDNQVSSTQLVIEQLTQTGVVIEAVIGEALCLNLIDIVGITAGRNGRTIDDGNNRIDGTMLLDVRPVESLHQRLRQRQTGGLDENVIDVVATLDQLLHDRKELFLDRAADAAVGQLVNPVVGLSACLDLVFAIQRTGSQQVRVNIELTEFVDDNRNTLAGCLLQHARQQRGFAAAEKSGDNGGWDLVELHRACSAKKRQNFTQSPRTKPFSGPPVNVESAPLCCLLPTTTPSGRFSPLRIGLQCRANTGYPAPGGGKTTRVNLCTDFTICHHSINFPIMPAC